MSNNIQDIKLPDSMSPLVKEIEKRLGFLPNGLIFKIKKTDEGKIFVEVNTDNLNHKAGEIGRVMFEDIRLQNFGGCIFDDTMNQRIMAWIPIHFAYNLVKGGSNGVEFLTAFYNYNEKTWEFR